MSGREVPVGNTWHSRAVAQRATLAAMNLCRHLVEKGSILQQHVNLLERAAWPHINTAPVVYHGEPTISRPNFRPIKAAAKVLWSQQSGVNGPGHKCRPRHTCVILQCGCHTSKTFSKRSRQQQSLQDPCPMTPGAPEEHLVHSVSWLIQTSRNRKKAEEAVGNGVLCLSFRLPEKCCHVCSLVAADRFKQSTADHTYLHVHNSAVVLPGNSLLYCCPMLPRKPVYIAVSRWLLSLVVCDVEGQLQPADSSLQGVCVVSHKQHIHRWALILDCLKQYCL